MAIVQYTTKQCKKMKDLTDWARVRNMKDEDIDFSDSPNVADLLEKGLVRRVGRPLKNEVKKPISLRIAQSDLAKLRASGAGWQTRLSAKISQWINTSL